MNTRVVDLNGAPATVEDHGSGPPILLIGGAVPTAWANELTPELVKDGYRVINFDYRADPTGAHEAEGRTQVDLGRDAEALLDALDLTSLPVVGYSRGAVAAYWLAVNYPARVSHLILLAPVAPYKDLFVDVPVAEAPADPGEMLNHYADLLFSPRYLADNREAAMASIGAFAQAAAHVVRVPRQAEMAISEADSPPGPTAIITCEDDRMVDAVHSRRLDENIEGAVTVVLEGAAHAAPLESPKLVADAIAGFLAPPATDATE